MGSDTTVIRTSHVIKSAVISAAFGVGMFLAPSAAAAPAPPPPGPPAGQDGLPYHNMPGRIGHQPGAYTYILGFYLRPRRILDGAGVAAMANSDLQSSEFGMPGSQLGIEPTRRSWTGNAFGVRPQTPQDATGIADPAGGVRPGSTMPGGQPGLEDPIGKKPDRPALGGESTQPRVGGGIEPVSQNVGPDPDPAAGK